MVKYWTNEIELLSDILGKVTQNGLKLSAMFKINLTIVRRFNLCKCIQINAATKGKMNFRYDIWVNFAGYYMYTIALINSYHG